MDEETNIPVESRARVEVDAELVTNIEALIGSDRRAMVLNIVADLHEADAAVLLQRLPLESAGALFHWLDPEQAAEILPELDDGLRASLLADVGTARLAEFLGEMDTDDAADMLAELPDAVARQVLPNLDDAEALEVLLEYGEDTAGGIMGAEFVAVPKTWNVGEATEEVRRNADVVEPMYAVFVVDEKRRPVGAVSLKRLLLSPADALVYDVMDIDKVTVETGLDQEAVARIMERYDLVSLPVVDSTGVLLGRITIDDVVDVLREEAEEDIQRMSGVSGGEEPSDSILSISRGRIPWLFVGLAGAGMAALVVSRYTEQLREATVLAAFIPIVMAMAGNAGIQSSAIAVQGLASGEVWASDLLKRLAKETVVALLNGLILALVLGVAVILIVGDPGVVRLAVTASLSLVVVVVMATTIGAIVPLVFHRIGVDPAIATGPFITMTNDIISTLVFFLLATAIYL